MEAARIMIHPSYNEDGYTSNLSLAKARMSKSDVINPVVTFLQGNEQMLFPLLFLTEGQMKGVQWKGIEDVEYEWPIRYESDIIITSNISTINHFNNSRR